jgi:thioesterase domain-containing protein
VHPLGGDIYVYADLAKALDADQPFYGLRAPGIIDNDGPRPTSIEEFASLYVEEIRKSHPEGPYYLGGWCMGGTIALEMARILTSQGAEVAPVAMISTSLTFPVNPAYAYDEATILIDTFGAELSLTVDDLREMDPDQQVDLIFRKADDMGSAIARYLTKEEVWRRLELFGRHARALLDYRPQPYEGDVILLCPSIDDRPGGQSMGWAEVVTGRLIIDTIPGDHHEIMSAYVQDTAAQLNRYLFNPA